MSSVTKWYSKGVFVDCGMCDHLVLPNYLQRWMGNIAEIRKMMYFNISVIWDISDLRTTWSNFVRVLWLRLWSFIEIRKVTCCSVKPTNSRLLIATQTSNTHDVLKRIRGQMKILHSAGHVYVHSTVSIIWSWTGNGWGDYIYDWCVVAVTFWTLTMSLSCVTSSVDLATAF